VSIFIGSYDRAAKVFSTARSPEKGKPINTSIRLYREGDSYMLKIRDYGAESDWALAKTGGRYSYGSRGFTYAPLAIFHPSNTLEFVLSEETFWRESNSLTVVLDRITPIGALRFRKGVYKLGYVGDTYKFNKELWEELSAGQRNMPHNAQQMISKQDNAGLWREYYEKRRELWKGVRARGAIYKEGLIFDLDTGTYMGGKIDYRNRIIPEKRKEWLRMLRKFKRGIKMRIRIGTLDSLLKDIKDDTSNHNRGCLAPNWNSMEQLDMLEVAIRNEEFPVKLLDNLVRSTIGYAYRLSFTIEPQHVMREFDKIMRNTSISLRQRLGVFEAT